MQQHFSGTCIIERNAHLSGPDIHRSTWEDTQSRLAASQLLDNLVNSPIATDRNYNVDLLVYRFAS